MTDCGPKPHKCDSGCGGPCGGGCGCGGCGCKKPPADPSPTRLRCRQKVRLQPGDRAITLDGGCACGSPEDLSKTWLFIRRRGQDPWLVKYPAWDVDEAGNTMFLFDDLFLAQPPGRYEAQLRLAITECESKVCDVFEIALPKDCGTSTVRPRAVASEPMCFPDAPCGVYPVYEEIQTFCGALCGVLERGVRTLPLCDADIAALCGVTLCAPVQLVISDGVRTEIVEFTACDGETVTVERAMAGTSQYRFPPGSTVKFEWTQDNVARALTPSQNCIGQWVLV